MPTRCSCSSYRVHVPSVRGNPELDAARQVGSHQSRVEGQDPSACTALDAAQDVVFFLGCKLGHVELLIHKEPQVLFPRAALNPFPAQPLFLLGIALTKVWDLTLGLAEPHGIHIASLLTAVKVLLGGITSSMSVALLMYFLCWYNLLYKERLSLCHQNSLLHLSLLSGFNLAFETTNFNFWWQNNVRFVLLWVLNNKFQIGIDLYICISIYSKLEKKQTHQMA